MEHIIDKLVYYSKASDGHREKHKADFDRTLEAAILILREVRHIAKFELDYAPGGWNNLVYINIMKAVDQDVNEMSGPSKKAG